MPWRSQFSTTCVYEKCQVSKAGTSARDERAEYKGIKIRQRQVGESRFAGFDEAEQLKIKQRNLPTKCYALSWFTRTYSSLPCHAQRTIHCTRINQCVQRDAWPWQWHQWLHLQLCVVNMQTCMIISSALQKCIHKSRWFNLMQCDYAPAWSSMYLITVVQMPTTSYQGWVDWSETAKIHLKKILCLVILQLFVHTNVMLCIWKKKVKSVKLPAFQ